MKKRCLIFIPGYGLTGSTIYVSQYVNNLINKNFVVYIVCRKKDNGSDYLEKLGANIYYTNVAYNLDFTAGNMNSKGFITIIKFIIKFFLGFIFGFYYTVKIRPNFVIIGEFTLIQIILAIKLLNKKFVTLIQNDKTKNRFKKTIALRVLNYSNAIIGITKFEISDLIENNNIPKFVIHNSVLNFCDNDSIEFKKIYKSYDIKTKYSIIFLNGIFEHKGTLEFIKIAEKICNLRDDISFIIAGGYNCKFYTEYSRGNIITNYEFTKNVFSYIKSHNFNNKLKIIGETQFVHQLIQKSDIVLSIHQRPHFSRPIIEAFSNKKPVIASDDKYGRYLIEPGWNGYLLKKQDIDAWVNKCLFLIDNSQERNFLGNNAYIKYKNEFSEEHVQNQISEFFKYFVI